MTDTSTYMDYTQQSCNKSTLEIPTINLKIEVKRIDEKLFPIAQMCPNLQYARWDYVGGGTIWGVTYPTCNDDHQSPINLLKPYTTYGQSYDTFKAKEDELSSNFYELKSTTLDQQLRNNRVKISVS